jgi:hypothetical protein
MRPIAPKHIRYIKLGPRGAWEKRGITRGEIYFGRGVDHEHLLVKGDWDGLIRFFRKKGLLPAVASCFAREARDFETLGPDCLWVMFAMGFLWWGFAAPKVIPLGGDGRAHGTRMRHIIGGWRNKDIHGRPLAQEGLSTKLTQVAACRHTMCGVKEREYLLRRINGQEEPLVARAAIVRNAMIEVASDAIASLHWADFESLVDLIFARTGWQRVSRLGGHQKDIDLELEQPTTEERAFVQIKSQASQSDLDAYMAKFGRGTWGRMFFVCHTPQGQLKSKARSDVHVWTRETLASAAVRAGLYDWVVQKVG